MTQVFVLAAPGRDAAHRRLRASLHRSDVGEIYAWCENPPGVLPIDHWSATFQRMAESEHEHVVLLEDDALVNRHLLHNIRTWPALKDEQCGAGWLYSPGGWCGGKDRWADARYGYWHGTVGVVYRRDRIQRIHERAMAWMRAHYRSFDFSVSHAVLSIGWKIRQHGPPIVEHQYDVPSTLGHDKDNLWDVATTRGTFRDEWRRAV